MANSAALSPKIMKALKKAAQAVHQTWDQAWPALKPRIESQGQDILCREGCCDCCFTRKFCSLSEGLLIADYMANQFSPEKHEHFRLRVESTHSSLQKLREDDACHSESNFYRAGGLECPFLEKESCAIYPVRPLDCRTQYVTSNIQLEQCRQCAHSVSCVETEAKNVLLQKKLKENERTLNIPEPFDSGTPLMVSEVLSLLWESGIPAPTFQVTENSWKERLESRGTPFDHTWQDDRYDFRLLKTPPLVLPEEGEYPPDLLVLKINPEVHQIYNESITAKEFDELRVLYKVLPDGEFDWEKKVFRNKNGGDPNDSHIVWMGDSIQERLMMWEAVKRCRGRVLCGGMGMGIFPQYAMTLPRIESVHIVDMNPDVIAMIQKNWRNNPWPRMNDVTATHSKIEDFLKTTKEKFDTVYIDTWDALTEEYLPHINYLRKLSEGILKPGGEMIFWGYDLMVRLFLNQARNILNRHEYFLAADSWQMETLAEQTPLFHDLLDWFKNHPDCKDDDLYSEAYRLALHECRNLGVLALSNHPGFEQTKKNG